MDAIICPMCGTENPADATYCGNCRVNLRLALKDPGEIKRALRDSVPRPSSEHSPALGDIPSGLLVQQDADGLKASFRWFSWERLLVSIPGTAFALLCAAFGWFIFSEHEPGESMSCFAVFPLGFLVLGLWGLYTILVITLNRTKVEVTGGEFRVRHGPLAIRRKWAIGCDIPWKLQIEEVSKRAIPIIIPAEGGGAILPAVKLFQLSVWLPGEEKEVLFSSPDREVAVFLQSAIEKYSSIQAGGRGVDLSPRPGR